MSLRMSKYERFRTGSINSPENLFITVRRRNYFRLSYLILQSSQSFHKTRKPFTIICGSEQTATFQKKLFDQMNEIGSAHHMNEGLKFSAAYVQIATVGMTRSLLPLFGMTELSASRKKKNSPRRGVLFRLLHHRPFRLIASTTRSVCSRTLVSDIRFEIIA